MSDGLSAGLYPITMYVTTGIIIINIFLIYSGKTIFYTDTKDRSLTGTDGRTSKFGPGQSGKKVEVRLSTTIFYIYLIMIFIYALGQYVYYDKSSQIIQMARTKSKVILTVELIISIFNVIGILFLSYHIYFEIRNLNDTECPYPNQMICHADESECPLSKQICPSENTDYKFTDCYSLENGIRSKYLAEPGYNNKYKLLPQHVNNSTCLPNLTNFFKNNFLVESDESDTLHDPPPPGPPPPPGSPPEDTDVYSCINSVYNSNASCVSGEDNSLTIFNESASPCDGPCTQEQCCMAEDMGGIEQDDPRYSWIAREDKLVEVEGEVEQILAKISGSVSSGGIAGPPGPPGPPGTPGSDARQPASTSPSQNLQSNIVCSADGVCPAGKTKCNDKGQCVENFALISLEEKINLQNKYKDLNHNSYKVEKLMNNLEQYLLKHI